MKTIKRENRPASTDEIFVAKINGMKTKSLKKLYKKVCKKLNFPDYFGHNLDALADCLSDLSWIEQPNVKLCIRNKEALLANEDEETRESVWEILKESAECPIDEDRTFEVIDVI